MILKKYQLELKPVIPWIAILGFVIFSSLCISLGLGRLINLAFPAGAFVVGLILYLRAPILYVGFTWWLVFLTPLIRRLADWRSQFTDPSPILLAPYLVTFISFWTLYRYLPKIHRQGGLPFVLCFFSVVYAFLIGLIQNPLAGAIRDFLEWMAPVLFGFHLFVNWQQYPQYRQSFYRIFLWGVLVMGSYGIWQYCVAPEWDRVWLLNTGEITFGLPEPFEIRVWSTMNAPQSFASVMMAGLLLLISGQGVQSYAIAGVGYLSFLLTLARSGWLSWIAGFLVLLPTLKLKLQIRLVTAAILILLLVVPLTTLETFSTRINSRLETFSSVESENSYQARVETYQEMFGKALTEVIGKGLGNKLTQDDSAILKMLFSLGWFGTIPYVLGIGLIASQLFQGGVKRDDAFACAAFAIVWGNIAQMGLNAIIVGQSGMVLWGFLGLGQASVVYYRNNPTRN